MIRKINFPLLIIMIFITAIVFLIFRNPYHDVIKNIRLLPHGDSIDKIKVETSRNNINPYDTTQRIDNIIFKISIKKSRLTDDEIEELGISIQYLLDEKIQDTIDADTGNLIRINMSIFPLSDTLIDIDNRNADGFGFYRAYDFESAQFEWTHHAYISYP